MLLFVIAVLLSVKIIVNSFSVNTDFEILKDDATKMSEIFLSEGNPAAWTNETVIRPGLLTDYRLNESKVTLAMNITNTSYSYFKLKLQTNYDFLVGFQLKNDTIMNFNGFYSIGDPSVDVNSTDIYWAGVAYDDLVKLTRFVVYGSEVMRMVVYTWD